MFTGLAQINRLSDTYHRNQKSPAMYNINTDNFNNYNTGTNNYNHYAG